MLLMIDNYDSFTYNLVQYFGELGAAVEVHRNDMITVDEIKAMQPERIVITAAGNLELMAVRVEEIDTVGDAVIHGAGDPVAQ